MNSFSFGRALLNFRLPCPAFALVAVGVVALLIGRADVERPGYRVGLVAPAI
jgi:hypothetical protein